MNIVIWDIETDSSNTFFGTIIEIGAILMNDNFKELDKLNIRCRLPEGVVPQAGALLVNQSNISMLTKANYSHYQMLQEVETTFKKWSPAVFLGYSNINFDDEMLRKEFFKGLRQPYLTNTNGNKRQDGLNIVRAAFAVNDNIMKTEDNPFQAFDEEEGFDFANRKMGEALKQALDMEDYATAKKYMFENQVRFEDLGFADTEADQFIDSVLEELYYGEE